MGEAAPNTHTERSVGREVAPARVVELKRETPVQFPNAPEWQQAVFRTEQNTQEVRDHLKEKEKSLKRLEGERGEAHDFFQPISREAYRASVEEPAVFEQHMLRVIRNAVADKVARDGVYDKLESFQPIPFGPDTRISIPGLNDKQKELVRRSGLSLEDLIRRGVVSLQLETQQEVQKESALEKEHYDRSKSVSRVLASGRFGDPQGQNKIRYEVMSGTPDPTQKKDTEQFIASGILHGLEDEKDTLIFSRLMLGYHQKTLDMFDKNIERLRAVADGDRGLLKAKEQVMRAAQLRAQFPDTRFAQLIDRELEHALESDEIGYLDRFVRANSTVLAQAEELLEERGEKGRRLVEKILNHSDFTSFVEPEPNGDTNHLDVRKVA